MGMGWDKLLTWIGMELADLGLTELDPELGTAQPLLVLDLFLVSRMILMDSISIFCNA